MDIRVPAGRQVTKYSAFAAMHPWTNFIYITLVLVITMFTMNPVILAVSYAGSLALGIYMQGGSFIKKNIMITIPVAIFSVLIQPIFNHSGVTPLFYINDNMVCLNIRCSYKSFINCSHTMVQCCSQLSFFGENDVSVRKFYSFCWHDIFYDIKNDTAYEKEMQTNT